MLHITNGDSVLCSFESVSMPGEYLSWRDILHEGPVPQTETLAELSAIRARFVADCGWTSYGEALEELSRRDDVLARSHEQDEVVLWFEYDLFDQLQLLQVMDWYHTHRPLPGRLTLIHPEGYLGAMPGEVLNGIFPYRQAVHEQQLELAHRGWQAFTRPDPAGILQMVTENATALPYLTANFLRFLEEYPSTHNGLSRSQEQILKAIAAGHRDEAEIFAAFCEWEEPVFMGDSTVWQRLRQLADEPAAVRNDGGYALTDLGRQLLAGEADWIRACGGIDVWMGGVHLQGSDAAWRWDAGAKTLRKR
ncbi:MAG TPA: hypothetical protein VM120_12420 [Bryobacteraceae bacterium]|nr:hypothetical protein [Bryobacteraceae bacterium]